ncbi:MAG TPA: DUF1571 domain-containing protein [Bacteroidales bacterium]|nr:DUF1571 domain-containing protein [Bacteroidales bacterium]
MKMILNLANKFLKYFCLALVLLVNHSAHAEDYAIQLLEQMRQKANEVKTLRYDAVMNERIKGKMVEKVSSFKINTSPEKIYVAQSFIGIKLDALYCQGWNNNQLRVATVGFPWLELNLDPLGSMVRNNHHHTIFEAGFTYFVNIIGQIVDDPNRQLTITYMGNVKRNGISCQRINICNKKYAIIKYQIKAGENLTTIAKRLNINDYKILELNPEIDDYTDVKPGQIINIPNTYAKSLDLFIDETIMLPVLIDIYDENGQYGSYGYKNLVINKPFAADEFSITYKDYHFKKK